MQVIDSSDTAHTNSLREQLLVTKKLSAVFGNLMGKEKCYEQYVTDENRRRNTDNSIQAEGVHH